MEHVDLIVAGSSLAGIRCALELKRSGHSVLLTTHRSYLGEDLCDPLRLALPKDLNSEDPILTRLFGDAMEQGHCFRPMQLKYELDRLLEEADIPVLLCAMPVSISQEGDLLQLDLHTRSGRRQLQCRRLLDNTPRGEVGRLAGIPLSAPCSPVLVTRRVLAEQLAEGWESEGILDMPQGDAEDTRLQLLRREESLSLSDGSWAQWMGMEQVMRLNSYVPGQLYSADGIEAWTGERLHPDRAPVECEGDIEALPASACSAAEGRLWFSGNVLAADQRTLQQLTRPDEALKWGSHLASLLEAAEAPGTMPAQAEPPELELDVLVVGGGTGGAPAGISASREGASTLVVEALSGLGGVGTLGMIGRYWFGNQVGFTAEMDQAVAEKSPRNIEGGAYGGWDVEAKIQWYHEEISKAGGHIWYKCCPAGARAHDGRVDEVHLATPQGLVIVRPRTVVDATGSGEVAAMAGAQTVSVGSARLALQGTGLPNRTPGQDYNNTDYEFIDDSQAEDLASAHVSAREKFKHEFDAGQLVDSRERRRVVGDLEISPMDIRLSRIFPDTLVKARSNFDTHGYTIHPLFMIVPPGHDPIEAYIPLRALLPRGLEGILVTGLGISAHRDAMPVIRMQADVQNQGYAAGMIAALSQGLDLRSLDIDMLQERLVDKGILDPEIRGAGDSFPLPEAEVKEALTLAPGQPDLIDRVFTLDPSTRVAWLQEAMENAEGLEAKRFYAFVLGILEDDCGVQFLMDEVTEREWDPGWDYTGMGQFGASMSELDTRIIALARCRHADAAELLADKLPSLPEEAAFSHMRALAEAFETLGSGAEHLESLLTRPGIRGHAVRNQRERNAVGEGSVVETQHRNRALIELHLATSLYQLKPDSELAREVLESYCKDLRGLFSRHASQLISA